MAKRSRSKDSIKTTRSLIEGLFTHLGIADKIGQHRAWLVWKECVGSQIAAHATPIRIRDNILEVRVDHPVWMQQLQLLKPQLLKKLNAELADAPLNDLFFRRGRMAEATPAPAPRPKLPDLDKDERTEIHQLTAEIEDPETRDALEHLLKKQRQLDKLHSKK
ncbi:MAG: DUF721 domain-containing protein [Desulfuromonas sp.]|nr:DUF721 domain-containing protein [Desulfuromonas sp.]